MGMRERHIGERLKNMIAQIVRNRNNAKSII